MASPFDQLRPDDRPREGIIGPRVPLFAFISGTVDSRKSGRIARQEEFDVASLKRIVIATLAAITVTAGSIALVPTASALPRMECEDKFELSFYYWHLGWQYYAFHDFAKAAYYWNLSDVIYRGC